MSRRVDLDLAVLHVLGVDEQDVVEHVELLQQRGADEAVEITAGDKAEALGELGGHGLVISRTHRRVL